MSHTRADIANSTSLLRICSLDSFCVTQPRCYPCSSLLPALDCMSHDLIGRSRPCCCYKLVSSVTSVSAMRREPKTYMLCCATDIIDGCLSRKRRPSRVSRFESLASMQPSNLCSCVEHDLWQYVHTGAGFECTRVLSTVTLSRGHQTIVAHSRHSGKVISRATHSITCGL